MLLKVILAAHTLTSTDALNSNRLGSLHVRGRHLLLGVKLVVEEGVDQRRLAKTAFACQPQANDDDGQPLPLATVAPRHRGSHSPTTMAVKLNPFRTERRCH